MLFRIDYKSDFGRLFCLDEPFNPFEADPSLAKNSYFKQVYHVDNEVYVEMWVHLVMAVINILSMVI